MILLPPAPSGHTGLSAHEYRFQMLFATAAPEQERPPIEDLINAPQSRTSSLDAPSWLWSSVVVAKHEAAYLDHCRRYALAVAA
jgi:uncharacterized protein (DUF2252 family)